MEEQKPKLKKGDRVMAKPAFWDVNLNSNGKPFAKVKFNNGLVYIGYLSEAAVEKTCKELAYMGFNGETPYDLKKEDALDKMTEVELTIDIDKYTDKQGKEREMPTVAFVNMPFKKSDLDASEVAQLKSLDLRGYLAEHKRERPKTQAPTQSQDKSSQRSNDGFPEPDSRGQDFNNDSSFSADDIPF